MLPVPSESDCFTALRNFLLDVLPAGTEVVQGQVNRVPEPLGNDFVVMWGLLRPRFATNIDTDDDVRFTGSITGTVMTVASIQFGTITYPSLLFGVGVPSGSQILSQLSGTPGGVGTYSISPSQTVVDRVMSSGGEELLQKAGWNVQLDVHGPNSADNAQIISTAFRDDYAVQFFAAENSAISPLYADDPRQAPFINDQQQYENRWTIDAHLQVDTTVRVPQQFADSVEVDLVEVDAVYPP